MEKKKIKITLESDGKILLYNNGVVKKTIDKDCNEISGNDIMDLLDAKLNDSFEMEPIQEEDKNSRYKVYKMIHELIKGIVDKIVTEETEFTFDVDATEKKPLEIQEEE